MFSHLLNRVAFRPVNGYIEILKDFCFGNAARDCCLAVRLKTVGYMLYDCTFNFTKIMEKQSSKKKITWSIKNFSLKYEDEIYSDQFIVGGCKWRLCAYLSTGYLGFLCYYLEVADYRSLPFGWRRHARYVPYPVKQNSVKHSGQNEEQKWFDEDSPNCSIKSWYHLNGILQKNIGIRVIGELKMVAEVEVLEVIGELDVSKSKMTSTIMEDVNGFQLLSSQVELVTHMFERHPEIASGFRLENPNLRTGCMSLLHSLVEALLYSPQVLQKADLTAAYALLGFMTDAGYKLDWLKKKLDQMSEKKEKEEAGESRMQEIEEELKGLKQKCSELEAELEKEKSEVSAAKAPFSLDDLF